MVIARHETKRHRILSLVNVVIGLLIVVPSGAETHARPAAIQYLSPIPGAVLVSRETNIIVRFDGGLVRYVVELETMFTVVGSQSGGHFGEAVVSDDGETIVFEPDIPFGPGETVSVTVRYRDRTTNIATTSYAFDFVVSQKRSRPEENLPTCLEVESPERGNTHAAEYSPPEGFPPVHIGAVNNPGDGYIFLTNYLWVYPYPAPSYLMILDNTGAPVYFKKSDSFVLDFKKQTDELLSYFEFGPFGHIVMDSTYQTVDVCRCGNGYVVDTHDFNVLDNGHYLIICQDRQIVDMSQVVEGGDPNATVIGMIYQELDLSKNVVFEWRSWDHFDITDAIGVDLSAKTIDPFHSNALFPDSDGNLLVSSRHLSEVTKINRSTGEIIWRLGGKKNQFRFVGDIDDSTGFHYQHDIRRLPNGNVTLYDNGNFHSPQFSRAVEYRLDSGNMTATRVWQYRDSPDVYAYYLGSAQRLTGGNTVITWGGSKFAGTPTLTEVHPDGTKALELTFGNGTLAYRGYRFPWSGTAPKPSMWEGGFDKRTRTLTLHFDKFGDRDVVGYLLYIGEYPGPLVLADSTTSKRIDITDLRPNSRYFFRVRSVDKWSNIGPYSNEIAFEYVNTAPSVVRLVSPESNAIVETATVALSWTGAGDAERDSLLYTLHIMGDGGETTIKGLADTFYVYSANGQGPLPKFEWTVSSSDFYYSTASPDTFCIRSSRAGFGVPAAYRLYQNYPNPFTPSTMIRYDLHQGGHSTLRIYNVRGQEVRTLVDDNRPAGFWSTEWDGRDNTGNSVGSGVYLYKLETPAFSHSKKMTLIR
jgi:hypothetical protein